MYKPSPEQIDFYAYHRWAINPCEFVTNSVIERLRASGDFARVKPYDGRPDAEYVLSGRLEKLEEIDYEGGVKVEVAISAQMTNLATGLTVWTNAVSEVGDVNKRDVPAVVSEMNRTMERAIEKLLSPMPADVATGPTAAERNCRSLQDSASTRFACKSRIASSDTIYPALSPWLERRRAMNSRHFDFDFPSD